MEKTPVLILSALVLVLPSGIAAPHDQLADDIKVIGSAVEDEERPHVERFLREGTSGLDDASITGIIAKNALNKLESQIDGKVLVPLVRTMKRLVENAEFPDDTRRYALAEDITGRKNDTLRPTAEEYLPGQGDG